MKRDERLLVLWYVWLVVLVMVAAYLMIYGWGRLLHLARLLRIDANWRRAISLLAQHLLRSAFRRAKT